MRPHLLEGFENKRFKPFPVAQNMCPNKSLERKWCNSIIIIGAQELGSSISDV